MRAVAGAVERTYTEPVRRVLDFIETRCAKEVPPNKGCAPRKSERAKEAQHQARRPR